MAIIRTKNKRIRRLLINLTDYPPTLKGLEDIQNDLRERLKDNLFEYENMTDLHYETFRFIKPINKSVRKTEKSILNSAIEVVNHFKLLSKGAKITNLNNGEEIKSENNFDDPIKLFQMMVLGLDKLPKKEHEKLEKKVKIDLYAINKLIKEYERHPIVINYLLGKEKVRTHKAKTIIDFYSRVLEERQKILDYYLEGMSDRAIINSQAHILDFMVFQWDKEFKDFPYEFNSRLGRNFDYNKIDKVTHRLSLIGTAKYEQLKEIYSKNKRLFYSKYFKITPPNQFFRIIEYNLHHVPASINRKTIFKELEQLFNEKKWLSFYALSLPQVEGLFSEMVAATNPDSSVLKKALPDKVDSVRPNYYMHIHYLDYYQYYLPEQRNRFVHYGSVDDVELKSYDLLTDLNHILQIFLELDEPFVKLTRRLKRRNIDNFISYRDFAEYFVFLLKSNPKKKNEIKDEIDEFHKEFLSKECQIEHIAYEAASDMNNVIKDLTTKMEYHFGNYNLHIGFKSIIKSDIDQLMQDEVFFEKAKDFLIYYKNEFQKLLVIKDFYEGYFKYLKKYVKDNKMIKKSLNYWVSNKKIIINFKLIIDKIEI